MNPPTQHKPDIKTYKIRLKGFNRWFVFPWETLIDKLEEAQEGEIYEVSKYKEMSWIEYLENVLGTRSKK